MKRLLCAFLALGVLCAFLGCQKSGLPKPAFPLTEDAVNAALEERGLPWYLAGDETFSSRQGHIAYSLRHETQSFPASGNKVLPAAISCALLDGGRVLYCDFLSYPEPVDGVTKLPPFAWEDWKEQIIFATVLFGGFSDEKEVYRAFSGQGIPKGVEWAFSGQAMPEGAQRPEWTAKLPGGYCVARYRVSGIPDSPHGLLQISLFESQALYEKLEADKQANAAVLKAAREKKEKKGKPLQ